MGTPPGLQMVQDLFAAVLNRCPLVALEWHAADLPASLAHVRCVSCNIHTWCHSPAMVLELPMTCTERQAIPPQTGLRDVCSTRGSLQASSAGSGSSTWLCSEPACICLPGLGWVELGLLRCLKQLQSCFAILQRGAWQR